MMSDFEAETRHKSILNGIRNKWRVASSKYQEKIKNIKITTEKANNKRQKDYKKRFKEKDLAIQNQLELNRVAKIKEKNKRDEHLKKKNENVGKNLEFHNRQMEIERLRVEENTMKKSN